MAKVSPFLWFEGNMQEAVSFYMSVFKEAKLVSMNPAMATFELLGQRFLALNAHPHHKFNEAISFFIECDTQAEVDYYWARLAEGGGRAAVRLAQGPVRALVAGDPEGAWAIPDGRRS